MSTHPVYVFAKWQVKKGQIDDVLSLLAQVAQATLKEPGNLFYKIHQSTSDANTIVLFEGYTSIAAMDEHRNSTHFQALVIGKIVPELENREVTVVSQLMLNGNKTDESA
jgi:autoinducer 2-degrading protein